MKKLRPWMIVLVANLIFLAAIYRFNDNTVYEFIFPKQGGGVGGLGYDGQFTYFIARDPLGAPALIQERRDIPAYRYQRMLHPFLARILSLGQEPLIPYAMVIIALVGLVAGTWALEELLTDMGQSRWYALIYGLFSGVFVAVRMTTTESLAFGLVLLAILAERRGHLLWQAGLLALAVLAKEPTLFFVVGYVLYFAANKRWRDALRLSAIAITPFALWQLYMLLWIGQLGIGSGGAGATPFEIIPFNGLWQIYAVSPQLFASLGIYLILGTVLPTVFALMSTSFGLLRREWDNPYLFLLFINAIIIPFTPFSTYREPNGIIRFLPGLVLSFVLYAARRASLERGRRPLSYSALWVLWGLILIA